MKLRVRGNALRLRLQQSEVRKLDDEGEVSETISFSGQMLVYSLVSDENARDLSSSFDGNRIRVAIPRHVAHEWANSEIVGLSNEDSSPKLLIEKDFACLKPRTSAQWEDESDAFPNPNPTCGHKT